MGNTTEDFISSFHSLNGTTIGERRKNLNLLLNETQIGEYGELDFSLLQPRTPLEEKLKVEILIYFKRVPELLEVLKSEDPILIESILKNSSWFLDEAFQNVTGEQLATSVFPYISFNTKVKLINRFALHLKNPQQADLYFKAIEKKYGLYLASKFLPSCSADLIMNCVKINRTKIMPRQLLIIIKKYPDITELILKELSSHVNIQNEYKNIFVYLSQQNILLFLKLYNEYNLSFSLGWRTTDKIVQSNKEDVIQNPGKFYKILHNKQIAKSLNAAFKDLYLNLFPPSLKQFRKSSYANILNILRQLPLKKRNVDLLLTNFEKVYGSRLWDHSELINVELLDIMPANERESNIKPESKPCDIPEDTWYCYMQTEKSIPYLKKAISLSSDIKARVNCIQLLVKTCKINEDRAVLADICNYMVTRHRNDHISVRLGFLNKLLESFKLEVLEEQHWTPINELIKIFTLNDEPFYHLHDYLEGFIHFRLRNNLPIKEQIAQWINVYYEEIKIIQEKPQFEKQCLLTLGEVIPELFKELNLEQYSIRFLNALMNWNKRHPEDEISLYSYPNMISCIKSSLTGDNYIYNIGILLKYLFQTKTNSEQRTDLLSLYFGRAANVPIDHEIINWLIHHEPSPVILNIDTVTKRLLQLYYKNSLRPFWKYCRYYTHLEIPQKVVAICLVLLEEKLEDNRDMITKNAVAALSHLMTSEEFKQFSVPHYPSRLRVNSKSKKGQKTYKMQQNIGLYLRNLNPPSSAMESILMFCKGDYLRLIQSSLYSVSDHVNEDKLPPFFVELAKRTVSMRKQAMHLTFRVLDKEQIYSLLNKFMQTEKNASICKTIFKSVFNYFLTNPDDYSWELVKINANAVDINDKEAFDVLMQTEKVASLYFVQYVLFAWDILNRFSDPERNVESNKALLLCSIKLNVIPLLPKEFCDGIIKEYLFKCNFQSAVQTFTCRYIIYCNSHAEQQERLNSNFSLLKDYIATTCHDSDNRAGACSCVENFVKCFCLEFLTDKCLNTEILTKFVNLWNASFKPHDAFDEYLHLQFTLIYVERLTVPQIGHKLASLCNSLANVYGAFILGAFCEKINAFTEYFLHGMDDVLEENRYVLTRSLIGPDSSSACLILVLLLLNGHEPSTIKTEEQHKGIIDTLEKISDPVIRLHLHSYFRDRLL